MAAINFPSSPTNGDTYTDDLDKVWVYSSAKNRWKPATLLGSGTTISATEPTGPADGAGWFDSATGILSFWSVDADAWLVPTTFNSTTPANAYLNGDGASYINGDGAYYVAA